MVTVIVGIRVESATCERARNLMTSLAALRKQTVSRDRYRIVLVEQSTEPRLEQTTTPIADDYVFAYNPGPFNRSWVLNVGAARAAAGVICTFDADLVVPPEFLRRGLLAWQCGALAIKPYSGILYMDAPSTERVHQAVWNGDAVDCDAPHHRGALHPWSKGGCIWIDSRLYLELGGHDERFEGWGDEDREFWDRLTRRTSVVTLTGRLLHLYHAREFERRPEVRANRLLWYALQKGLLLPVPRFSSIGDVNRYRRNGGISRSDINNASAQTNDGPSRGDALRALVLREAERICRGTDAWNARDPEGLRARGRLAARKRDDEVALTCLTRAVQMDPSDPAAYTDLGGLLLRRGRVIDAVHAQLRAVAITPECALAFRELGRALRRAGRLSESAWTYRESLQLDRGNTRTLGELGDVLGMQGHLDQSLSACEIGQRLVPDDSTGYLRLGQARLARQEWDLALDAFRQGVGLCEAPAAAGHVETSRSSGDAFGACDPSAIDGDQHADDHLHVALLVGSGEALLRLNARDDAAAHFVTALALDAKNIRAARGLVLALEGLHRRDEAVGAWVSLGVALDAHHRFEEAAVAYQMAVTGSPNCLKALIHLGKAQAAQGKTTMAIRCLERALTVEPQSPQAHSELGRARHTVGDTDAGWRDFAWWCHSHRLQERTFEQPVWDGSPPSGRTILVWADQELGDTIHWLRYLSPLNQLGARIIVECQDRLVPLVRTVAGIDLVLARHAPLPSFDVHVPLTLLPVLSYTCRSAPSAAPYLRADPTLVEVWRRRLGSWPLTVGLSWAGHPAGINAAFRFARLAEFSPLQGLSHVRFVSLQMGPQAAELLGGQQGFVVEHLQDDSCSMADTAALMSSLDLVITVDTMIAHLAGALGRPVWLLLPYVADWRWLQDPDRSSLYPTMRLFRQARPNDWAGVMRRAREALGTFATYSHRSRRSQVSGGADELSLPASSSSH